MQHVLVVNTGKPEAVEALLGGFAVVCTVLTEEKYASSYGSSQEVVTVPSVNDLPAVAEAAARIDRAHTVDRVVAPTERSVPAGGFVRDLLDLPGMRRKTARLFTDKLAMKQALRSSGIDVAEFVDPTLLDDVSSFIASAPVGCIIKPTLGSGSVGTQAVMSADDLPAWVGGRPSILEKRVPMTAEIHSEGVVRHGRLTSAHSFRYFAPVLGTEGLLSGSVAISDQSRASEIAELHQRVVSCLGLHDGVTHFQLFETGTGLLVNEIASRPPGGGIVEQVFRSGGVDVWRAFLSAELRVDGDLHDGRRKPAGRAVRIKLPLPRGRVIDVSGIDELRALPRTDVVVTYGPGDEPPPLVHSGATGGYVFSLVGEDRDAYDLFEHVRQTFRYVSDRSLP
jgi:hypothetical protein